MTRTFLALSTMIAILACAGGGKGEESGGGDDTSSGGPADPTPASDACSTYLACMSAIEPGAAAALEEQYGDASACWDDQATSAGCTDECLAAVEALQVANPTVEECFVGVGNLQPCGLFAGDWSWTVSPASAECPDNAIYDVSGDNELDCVDADARIVQVSAQCGQDEGGPVYCHVDCTVEGDQLRCGDPSTAEGMDLVATLSVTGAALEGEWTFLDDPQGTANDCEASGSVTGAVR